MQDSLHHHSAGPATTLQPRAAIRTPIQRWTTQYHRERQMRSEKEEQVKTLQEENAHLRAELFARDAEQEHSHGSEDYKVLAALKALKASQDKELSVAADLRALEGRVDKLKQSTQKILKIKDVALKGVEESNERLREELAITKAELYNNQHRLTELEKGIAEKSAAREAGPGLLTSIFEFG